MINFLFRNLNHIFKDQTWLENKVIRMSNYTLRTISSESKLEYLNPLSDECKELAQKSYEAENVNAITMTDYNVMVTILGGILLQFGNTFSWE